MATLLNSRRASYQHPNMGGKGAKTPKATAKTVRMLQFSDSANFEAVHYRPIEERYLQAVARGCPAMNPMEVACALMMGRRVISDWTRIEGGKTYVVSVVTIQKSK